MLLQQAIDISLILSELLNL
ncbi:hypothetical protein A2U01_0103029, partial [Trifolium medium]|nr:hypothetical protein [Trifolium medium]